MRIKRKGTETSMPSSTVSVVSTHAGDDGVSSSWEETRQMLKNMRLCDDTDVMTSLQVCMELQASFQTEQELLVQQTENIKNQLENRIQQAREACQEESDDLYRMALKLQQLEADRIALRQGLEDIEGLERETKERIHQYSNEAIQEIDSIDEVEAERMRQVPRLKHQISLYAQTTGIKWDFNQDQVLAGEVAIPAKGKVSRFSIDPKEHSEFEVANHMWSLMAGNPSPAVTSVS